MSNSINPKKIELLEKMLNQLMPKIYPVIRYIKIDGPKKRMFTWVPYLSYDINVYTTIPEYITKDDYWTSDYRKMDFSYMGAYHINEMLRYIGLEPFDFYRQIFVYNINDELIGGF
jgi:hypothetical protein